MDERAEQRIQEFIQEKLNGEIDNFKSFDFKTLRNSEKFGCPGRYFDCDDTEIMRAVYVVLWGDFLPELSLDTSGNAEKYRGDTMNSFHTMFGREIPDRPGFYAGLERYNPSDEMRERVREFSHKYCSTIGNFVVLPNCYVQNTTLNFYRGTNQWRDFFDRFLIQLGNVLCGCDSPDPLLEKLVSANLFCFENFKGSNFKTWIRKLFLEDYCDSDGFPQTVFPLNYHWKNIDEPEVYFSDAMLYLERAEQIIENRSRNILSELKKTIRL